VEETLNFLKDTFSTPKENPSLPKLRKQIVLLREYIHKLASDSDQYNALKRHFKNKVLQLNLQLNLQLKSQELHSAVVNDLTLLHELKSQASTPESKPGQIDSKPPIASPQPVPEKSRHSSPVSQSDEKIHDALINLINSLIYKSKPSSLPPELCLDIADNIHKFLDQYETLKKPSAGENVKMTDVLKSLPNFLVNLKKLAKLLPADHLKLAMIEDLMRLLEEQSPYDSVLSAASTPTKETNTSFQNPAIKSDVIDPLDQFIKSSFDGLVEALNEIKICVDKKIEKYKNSCISLDSTNLELLKEILDIVHSLTDSYSQDDYSSFFFKKDTIKKLETLQTLLPRASVGNFLALYRFTAYESPNFKSLDTFTRTFKQHAQFFSSELSLGGLSLLQNHIKKNPTIKKAIDTIRRKPFLSCDRDMTSAMKTLKIVVEIKKLPPSIKLKLQSLLNAYNLIKTLSESGFSEEQLKQLFPEENYQLSTISE
jgi:hypothetical protein